MSEVGERVVLVRDVIAEDGDVWAAGDVLWVVGFRGHTEVVLVDDDRRYAVVRVEEVRDVPRVTRKFTRK